MSYLSKHTPISSSYGCQVHSDRTCTETLTSSSMCSSSTNYESTSPTLSGLLRSHLHHQVGSKHQLTPHISHCVALPDLSPLLSYWASQGLICTPILGANASWNFTSPVVLGYLSSHLSYHVGLAEVTPPPSYWAQMLVKASPSCCVSLTKVSSPPPFWEKMPVEAIPLLLYWISWALIALSWLRSHLYNHVGNKH